MSHSPRGTSPQFPASVEGPACPPANAVSGDFTAPTALYEQLLEGVAVHAPDGRFLYVNPSLERMCGKPRAELLGRSLWDVFPDLTLSTLRPAFERVIATGEPQAFEEFNAATRRWYADRLYLVDGQVWAFIQDITELKRLHDAERELRAHAEAEQARLESLFEHLPAIVAVYRASDLRYEYANPRMRALHGGRPLVGHTAREAPPHPRAAGLLSLLDTVARTGRSHTVEELSIEPPRDDGTPGGGYFHFTYQPVLGARGEVERIILFAMDVTEQVLARKRAEALAQLLCEGEARFRNMADHAPVMLWVTDPQGHCTYLNQQWYAATGQTEATALGMGWLDAVHPEDREATTEAFLAAHARQERFYAEYRLRGHDGAYRWSIDSASPRFDEGGAFLGYIGSVVDISEHRKVEEQRARLLGEAQYLAEASATLSSSLDTETTLAALARLAVPAFADWCFVDLAQADGSFKRVEVAHAFPHDAPLAQQVRHFGLRPEGNPHHPPTEALREGRSLLIEAFSPERIRQSAQSAAHARLMLAIQPVSFIGVPLVARGHTLGVLSFITSRSERRYTPAHLLLAEELARRAALSVDNARLYQEAQEAIRVRDEFLSVASHELKTPLTPISLRLQALAKETERQPDSPYVQRVRGAVEAGRKQVHKLSVLIGDLLDVSRISAGRLKLELERVDAAAIIREVVARYEGPATLAGSPLRVELPERLEGLWDRLRLEQVVTNLVDNAIKYGAGKPIRLQLGAEPERATLRVRDEGIGIEPAKLTRIFERFERAVSERHYGGLGLGLYITKTLVEAMDGTIHVASQPGQGATFTVDLPLAPRSR